MRTNRVGNLKRFFDIRETDSVLMLDTADAMCPKEAELYDYIFWNPSVSGERRYGISELFERLSQEGKLVVYQNNPYGLHAFAQGEIKAVGNAFSYPVLKEQVEELTGQALAYAKWYYPYPDVEFPCAFFSDERLPGNMECDDNFYHFDKPRMEAFDERKVTDRIVRAGMYPYLAQAHMAVLARREPGECPVYTRFSNERREDAQIRTDIYRDRVVKRALHPGAGEHVLSMQRREQALKECLKDVAVLGKPCDVNRILDVDTETNSVSFELVDGESLEQALDRLLDEGKEEEAARALLTFCENLGRNSALTEFFMTSSFENIFGEVKNWKDYGWRSLPVSDIDLIAQNILLSEKAVVIDYEWTFDFPVPAEFLMFRFLYFFLEAKNRTCTENSMLMQLYEKAGITEEMKEVFLAMETAFQHYVQKGAGVLCNSFDAEGKPVLTRAEIDRQVQQLGSKTITAVREGEREKSFHARAAQGGIYKYYIPEAESGMRLRLLGFRAPQDVKVLRIGAVAQRGKEHGGLSFETNGEHLGGLLYLYREEPEIRLCDDGEKAFHAEISVEEIDMSEAAMGELSTTIADMRFLIDNREQQIRDLKNSASWKLTRPLRALKGNKEE